MPFDFRWYDDDHTIIWLDIQGIITWEGYHSVFDNIFDEIDATSNRVDIVINDMVGFPKGNAIPHLKSVLGKAAKRENIGLIVVISTKQIAAVVKMLTDIITKFITFRTGIFVNSTEEAIERIQNDRLNDPMKHQGEGTL